MPFLTPIFKRYSKISTWGTVSFTLQCSGLKCSSNDAGMNLSTRLLTCYDGQYMSLSYVTGRVSGRELAANWVQASTRDTFPTFSIQDVNRRSPAPASIPRSDMYSLLSLGPYSREISSDRMLIHQKSPVASHKSTRTIY